MLRAGLGPVDTGRTYEAVKFPGMLETKRTWQPHPEWVARAAWWAFPNIPYRDAPEVESG